MQILYNHICDRFYIHIIAEYRLCNSHKHRLVYSTNNKKFKHNFKAAEILNRSNENQCKPKENERNAKDKSGTNPPEVIDIVAIYVT